MFCYYPLFSSYLQECKFIAFEYLNSYYLIYQYIENFNLIQKENPAEERMATPRINEIKDRVSIILNKNMIFMYTYLNSSTFY